MIFCTACGVEADEQASYCDQCGTALVAALPRVCETCGWRNRGAARFCGRCGTGLEVAAAAGVAAGEAAAPSVATTVARPEAPIPEPPAVSEPVAPAEAPVAPAEAGPVEAGPVEAGPSVSTPEAPAAAAANAAIEFGASPPAEREAGAPSREAARPPAAAPPREPPPPPGPSLADGAREWAASRQADILLYLGAFLLVAAALLFVSSQGTELSSELRVALLLVYTIGFTVAGLLAQRTDRIREAGMVFLAIGALITPLNFVLIYTELLDERDVPGELVWLIGSVYSALFYAVLWQRGYGRLYAVPAGIAVVSSWAALAAVTEVPREWLGTWWVLFIVVVSVAFDRLGRFSLNVAWTLGFLVWVIFAAQVADSDLIFGDGGRVPLAVSLVLITGWFALAGWSLRQPLLLPWGATVAIAAGIAGIRASGLDADWYAYSPLAMGMVAVATRRWWAHWHLGVARLGWLYAAACGASPVLFIPTYGDGANGAVAFLVGTAVLAAVAWRDRVDGFAFFEQADAGTPTALSERAGFGWVGYVLGLIGVGYTQRELGVSAPDTGWGYLVIAVATVALFAWRGRLWAPAQAVIVPPALLAMVVSLPES